MRVLGALLLLLLSFMLLVRGMHHCVGGGVCVNNNATVACLPPLHVWVITNVTELIDVHIALYPEAVNVTLLPEQFTPLHIAVMLGNIDAMKRLLAKRADVNAQDHLGRTPLYMALSDQEGLLDELKPVVARPWCTDGASTKYEL